jgi:translation initiation factor IF-2
MYACLTAVAPVAGPGGRVSGAGQGVRRAACVVGVLSFVFVAPTDTAPPVGCPLHPAHTPGNTAASHPFPPPPPLFPASPISSSFAGPGGADAPAAAHIPVFAAGEEGETPIGSTAVVGVPPTVANDPPGPGGPGSPATPPGPPPGLMSGAVAALPVAGSGRGGHGGGGTGLTAPPLPPPPTRTGIPSASQVGLATGTAGAPAVPGATATAHRDTSALAPSQASAVPPSGWHRHSLPAYGHGGGAGGVEVTGSAAGQGLSLSEMMAPSALGPPAPTPLPPVSPVEAGYSGTLSAARAPPGPGSAGGGGRGRGGRGGAARGRGGRGGWHWVRHDEGPPRACTHTHHWHDRACI